MDFTFTTPQGNTQSGQRMATSGAVPLMQPLQQQELQPTLFQHAPITTALPPAAAASTSTTPFTFNVLSAFDMDNVDPDNPYDRVSLKKSRGVGSTRQWRDRLISQVEDKIKEKRTSIQNSRRAGLVRISSDSGMSEPSSSQEPLSLSQQQLPGNESFESAMAELTPSQLTEEEHFRVVQEVWETFKRENYEELARDLEGMTEQDIADMEQEIYQYNYTTDYDPIYDSMMDMEDQDMDESIEMYMKMEQSSGASNSSAQEDNAVSTIPLSVSMLAQRPCIRCNLAPLQFESPASSTTTATSPMVSRAVCRGCGYSLEQDALHYIGTAAKNHSTWCAGQLSLSTDDDTGLLMLCSHCDFMA
ncbi:hypothetical protein EMPS_08524 [Entomortierella parvispora]|uniref:RPA-interacting protein C-terminal domain-containing protein n=1 Tax=Entomortierella parvispora TaxID=205924 RepID=A0A9P3LZP5_9FUNG|nr:hypothetical protein EMPS_08524 [Entomortierella parvispora]